MSESNVNQVILYCRYTQTNDILSLYIAEGSYREGDIRLVGGPTNWEGRVDIFWNGTWGTIIDSQWTVSDAHVVCRQLQHAAGSGMVVCLTLSTFHL